MSHLRYVIDVSSLLLIFEVEPDLVHVSSFSTSETCQSLPLKVYLRKVTCGLSEERRGISIGELELDAMDILVWYCPDQDCSWFCAKGERPNELLASTASHLLWGFKFPCFEIGEVERKLINPIAKASLDSCDTKVFIVDLEGFSTAASKRTSPHHY